MNHANELLSFIRSKYEFCLGAAGYPEGHIEAQSREKDLEYLKKKVDAGAEYIISNYFYNNDFFFDFLDNCRKSGINVPVIPGIMPVYSLKMMNMLANLCGATITEEIKKNTAALPEGDKEALLAFGVDLAVKQCRGLIKEGVSGLHFYTMDRAVSAQRIVQHLKGEGLV